jgi:hypothetical protein
LNAVSAIAATSDDNAADCFAFSLLTTSNVAGCRPYRIRPTFTAAACFAATITAVP